MNLIGLFNETAAWCESKAPFRELRVCFRTTELQPQLTPFPHANKLETLRAAVGFVGGRRRRLLATAPNGRPPGQVLVCEFNMSISSGESEYVTDGFFDVDDRPPWDTWICVLGVTIAGEADQAVLLSWVPEPLTAIVNEGIEENPYGCIYWVRTAPAEIKRHPLVARLLRTDC
jgi:hypothetical protein